MSHGVGLDLIFAVPGLDHTALQMIRFRCGNTRQAVVERFWWRDSWHNLTALPT
jgi:hypothetical protein